jgi:RNA polymerase sigma-70 factor (ECF subfamily)
MYSCEWDTLELVRKARLGDRDSLNRLAEAARVRLHEYVYRLTLQEDLTQDIVQETILEMLRLFGKLRQADRFWAWLQGIAFNKVRNHFGRQWRHKTRSLSQLTERDLPARQRSLDGQYEGQAHCSDALADAVTDELKQIVLHCIESLEPRHRAILTMRCYDQMSYADIGKLMDCSEIGARALFYRAKKALTSRLSRHGLGKGALVLALVLFGKMTAATKATAAEISITASTLSVGPTATLLATATSKTGLLTLALVAVVGVGSIGDWGSTREGSSRRVGLPSEIPDPRSALVTRQDDSAPSDRWYYFPEGPRQAVMMRQVQFDASGEGPVSLVLENQFANYHFDYGTNTVHIKNHRTWEEDLSVPRLQTYSPRLSRFLSPGEVTPVAPPSGGARPSATKGLLIMCRRQGNGEQTVQQVDRHLNVLEEEYFQFGWPQSARRIDERDAMHRHGRTYFRIHGQINGVVLAGTGHLPFTYAASRFYSPWIDIRIGNKLRAVDTKEGAVVYDQGNRVVARYPSGAFFRGLARPWLGLHSIDTVRRDAAEQQLWFRTQYDPRTGQAMVSVQSDPSVLTYVIDMEKDLVDRLELHPGPAKDGPTVTGQIAFTYSADEDSPDTGFAEPHVSVPETIKVKPQGMLWPIELLTMHDGATP